MWPHASEIVLPIEAAFLIPKAVDPVIANWCALAGVAYVGICRAAIRTGESVAIIGAGPVGQMAIRWAAISGAGTVVVVDPAEARLALARTGGASEVVAEPVATSGPAILAATGGKRPQVIIDATGRAATMAEALPLIADFGRLVVLG